MRFFALAGLLATAAFAQDSGAPRYAANGSLRFPADYREWVFLSSGLGMTYGPAAPAAGENPRFDNVFVNRAAYRAFLQTGTWPDKTVLVLEIRASQSKGSINQGGHFQADTAAIEVEVKDGGKWTFYSFGKAEADGKPFARTESCYACHAANGAADNTFVQFYPTLLPVAKEKHTLAGSGLPFTEHTIAADLKGGYQTVVADMNHDGKPDIIALASGGLDLVWFENPTWQKHVLATNLPKTINCAAEDIDGDGIPEIVLAWEFANNAANSIGKVGVLHHEGDPRQPWKLQQIDTLTTSHRLRWADIDGSGKKVAINAALTGARAAPPTYGGDHAPLVMYRPGDWKREVISEANEGVQHGILITKWDPKDKRDSILTASFSGIHLLQYGQNGWTRTELSKGDPSPCPKCGSSDIAIGYLGRDKLAKDKFLAAIEPWHGNQVAIYTLHGKTWERTQIDDSLTDGHTILTADLDGDGRDEVIAGFRQGSKSVFVYHETKNGWEKQILDNGGMGAASCAAADLNHDGAVDLVCIGSTTLKWYENTRH